MVAFERYSKLLVEPASQGNAGALKPDTTEDLIKRLGNLSLDERRQIRWALMPALARRQEREEMEQREAFEMLLADSQAFAAELRRIYLRADERGLDLGPRIEISEESLPLHDRSAVWLMAHGFAF